MLKEVILEYSREQLPEQKTENEYLSIKFKIDTYLSSLNPKKVITVGEILKELMNLYKIKNKVFADYIGLSESNLSAVISGRRSINNDLALKFGNIFNIAPELWFKHSK